MTIEEIFDKSKLPSREKGKIDFIRELFSLKPELTTRDLKAGLMNKLY